MLKPNYAKSIEDFIPLSKTSNINGLDYMKAILEGIFPTAPISETLNYRLIDVQEGKVVFRGSPGFNSLNPMGAVHGGWYGTVLDSAMACAVSTKVPKGFTSTTLEFKVNITKPIPMAMEVDIIGTCTHAGRSTGVAFAEIIGTDNRKLYASGSTTCMLLKVP